MKANPTELNRMDEQSDDDCIGRLLRTCASLTDKALSANILTAPDDVSEDHIDADIERETAISRWLDRQLLEYESRLKTLRNTGSTAFPAKSSRGVVQQQLVDASIRIQQEHMLLERIMRSRTARNVAFAKEPTPDDLLLQQAQQVCQRQVRRALEKSRELEQVQQDVMTATEDSRRMQTESRSCWESLVREGEDDVVISNPSTKESKDERQLRVLGRVLVDLVTSSNIDWYEDDKLQEIMQRLEQLDHR
jgi:hypothetical protein